MSTLTLLVTFQFFLDYVKSSRKLIKIPQFMNFKREPLKEDSRIKIQSEKVKK
jgi:hypothetical protein